MSGPTSIQEAINCQQFLKDLLVARVISDNTNIVRFPRGGLPISPKFLPDSPKLDRFPSPLCSRIQPANNAGLMKKPWGRRSGMDMGVDLRVVRWLAEQGRDAVHLRDKALHRLPNAGPGIPPPDPISASRRGIVPRSPQQIASPMPRLLRRGTGREASLEKFEKSGAGSGHVRGAMGKVGVEADCRLLAMRGSASAWLHRQLAHALGRRRDGGARQAPARPG
jgi:hypothetical protein